MTIPQTVDDPFRKITHTDEPFCRSFHTLMITHVTIANVCLLYLRIRIFNTLRIFFTFMTIYSFRFMTYGTIKIVIYCHNLSFKKLLNILIFYFFTFSISTSREGRIKICLFPTVM